MKKRIISFIMTIVLLLSVASTSFAVTAYADTASTTVDLTGNQVVDLINVAKSQVGYYSTGYTKYGAWAGKPYVSWCAAFISWCADAARISTSIIPKTISVGDFAKLGNYHFSTDKSGYVPSPGDIMLFKPLVSGSRSVYYTASIANGRYTAYSHVAIVVSADADNKTVTIIDGNWGYRVQYRTISLYQSYIAAYVTPAYTSGYSGSAITVNLGTDASYFELSVPQVETSEYLYGSGSDVVIKWNSVKHADSYKVRIYDAYGERVLVKDVKSTMYTAKNLANGNYTVTVTARAGSVMSDESDAIKFSIQNIAEDIDYKTVKEGVYTIMNADSGRFLGVKYDMFGDSSLVTSAFNDDSLIQSFRIVYVSEGKYCVYANYEQNSLAIDAGESVIATSSNYGTGSLFYIVPQSDGTYTFELSNNAGTVLTSGITTAAAQYGDVLMKLNGGEKLQEWYLCDENGEYTDASAKNELAEVITDFSVGNVGKKLVFTVTTSPSYSISRINLTDGYGKVVSYATSCIASDDGNVWTMECNAPDEDTTFQISYRLSSYFSYSSDVKTYKYTDDGSIHSLFKNVGYSVDDSKITLKVLTPATNFINAVRFSLAAMPTLEIATVTEHSVVGDCHLWTVEFDAPAQAVDFAVDYRMSATGEFAHDYCKLTVDSYDGTISKGIIKSVHKSVNDGEVTFIIKTSNELANLNEIMVTRGNDLSAPEYTSDKIECGDCLIWTVTLDCPEDSTQYEFYPVLGSDFVESESYSFVVNNVETKSFIKDVTQVVSDSKLVFSVLTDKTDEIDRVKICKADDCGRGIAVCSDPVETEDGYVWTVTVDEPKTTTAYTFDVRIASTSKYERNYRLYEYNKSGVIIDVSAEEAEGGVNFTVRTLAGCYANLRVNVDDDEYVTFDFIQDGDYYIWTAFVPDRTRGNSFYRFTVCSALTLAYTSDYYIMSY